MNTCRTCKRPDVDEINKLLSQNKPLRYIVDTFGIPNGSAQRHKENCFRPQFAQAIIEKRGGLLADVDAIKQKIDELNADFPKNPTTRNAVVQRWIDVLDREARLTGAFVKDQTNPTDEAELARILTQRLTEKGFSPEEARQIAQAEYKVQELGEAG